MDRLRKPPLLLALVGVLLVLGTELAGDAPGLAVPALALLDALLVTSLGLMSASLLLSGGAQGRLSAVAGLGISLLVTLAALGVGLAAVTLRLPVAAGLLLLPGSVGAVNAAVGQLLVLKVLVAVALVVAQPRFVQNRGLVLLLAASVGMTALVGLAFRVVIAPGFADTFAAIGVAVVGGVAALLLTLRALPAVRKIVG